MSSSPEFAVLFDWDGVVVDSSSHHFLSWQRLASDLGEEMTEELFRESFGLVNREIIPNTLGWASDPEEVHRLGARKEEIYREIIREKGLDPLPGVRRLIADMQSASIPRVVGTSSERENIYAALEVMKMEESFAGVIASEDVRNGKPDPEVFLKAAEVAGVSPQRCVVLEDSHHGLVAAAQGGMKAVGVLTTHSAEKLGSPDLLVPSIEEITVESLRSLFA